MASAFKVMCLVLLIRVAKNAELFEGDKCTRDDGSPGVCKIIETCEVAKEELGNGIVPKICSYINRLPVVCCPEPRLVTKPTPSPVTPTETPKPSPKPDIKLGKSKQKCKDYSSYVYKKSGVSPLVSDVDSPDKGTSECVIGKTLIIGGIEAEAKEFPHMALIGFGAKDSISWGCGGSLISERFVLTAAHCLSSRDFGVAKWIRLGDLNIKTTKDIVETQDFSIANKFPHPDYASPAHYNDIALLELDRNAKLNGFVRPACIHTEEAVPKEKFIASGWGITDWVGSDLSDILLKVGLDNVDPAICNDTFFPLIGGRKLRVGITTDTMICAGDLAGGKDTCKGDSGGPLQLKLKDPECMYDVVGITSFGSICGSRNSPAVYTRVSKFIPWIESIVWP